MSMQDSFRNKNWADYKGNSGSGYVRFPAQVSLCVIKKVDDYDLFSELFVDIITLPEEPRLSFNEFKHFFSKQAEKKAQEVGISDLYQFWRKEGKFKLWYGNAKSSEKDTVTKNLFKARITAIEESNPGYSLEKAGFNAQSLVGKIVIGVWGEREYVRQDGTTGVTVDLITFRSIGAYLDGDVEIPRRNTLADQNKKTVENTFKPSGTVKMEVPQEPKLSSYGSVVSEPDVSYNGSAFDVEIDDEDLPI